MVVGWIPVAQDSVRKTTQRTKIEVFFCTLLDPGDEGSTILRDVGNCIPVDTASHPRRLESLATPLCEPQISQRSERLISTKTGN